YAHGYDRYRRLIPGSLPGSTFAIGLKNGSNIAEAADMSALSTSKLEGKSLKLFIVRGGSDRAPLWIFHSAVPIALLFLAVIFFALWRMQPGTKAGIDPYLAAAIMCLSLALVRVIIDSYF